MGEYCTGPTRRFKDGQIPRVIYHAIELNEIHLALKPSKHLVRWMPETEIHSRNELTEECYSKDYDAIVTVTNNAGERTFALEYERLKARKEYLDIASNIEAERAVDRFLYLVPNYDLLSFLVGCFATVRRPIYFGLAGDFRDKLFDTAFARRETGRYDDTANCASIGLWSLRAETIPKRVPVLLPCDCMPLRFLSPIVVPFLSVSCLLVTPYV